MFLGLNILGLDLLSIFKFIVLVAGLMDAYKYVRQTNKIKRTKSSKNISRLFILLAIFSDILLISYCIYIRDAILIIIRSASLFTMCQVYWNIYKYYPFKHRKRRKGKLVKPNFFIFLQNSLTPNSMAKRL